MIEIAERIAQLPDAKALDGESRVPGALAEGAIESLAEGKTHYTDRPGILPLREWVAARYKSVEPEQVTITCGQEEAYFVVLMTLARDGSIYCPDLTLRETLQGAASLSNALFTDTPNDIAVSFDAGVTAEWYINTDNTPPEKTIFTGGFNPVAWRLGWVAGSEMALKLRAFKQSITICSTSTSQWGILEMVGHAE